MRRVEGRIERRALEPEDYLLFGHYVSNDIFRAERSQDRLEAQARAEQARLEAEQAATAKAAGELAAAAANLDGQTMNAEATPVSTTPTPEPQNTNTEAQPPGAPGPIRGAPDNNGGTSKRGKGNPIGGGHGKTKPSAFTRAQQVYHKLKGVIGSLCTRCSEGTMTRYREEVRIRVIGQPFFGAECHHAEQARCKACGRVVSALPVYVTEGVGKSITWDWSAAALLVMLHYFFGTPFKRIEILHKGWGIPLADASQWEIASGAITPVIPFVDSLIAWAIQNMTGFTMDDTGGEIRTLRRQIADELMAAKTMGLSEDSIRTGINASGFYIETPKGIVVLYFTGRHHVVEVLRKLLQHRRPGSPKVNKCTDGASKNFLDAEFRDNFEEGTCNTHALLYWWDHQDEFPTEYAIVGEGYHHIYQNEATAKARKMSDEERLAFHKQNSRPWMEKIRALCQEIAIARRAEPRTHLYSAVHFFLNQWPRLIKFCEVAGMPLDTNLCEQTLIAVSRYLKASFGYHTEKGAQVGDAGMSLIATARANKVEPWTWLTDCLKNQADLLKNPEAWFPWNWRDRMKAEQQTAPPENPSEAVHQTEE